MKALYNQKRTLVLVRNAEEPQRKPGEVKVRVHYASLNPTDTDIAKGDLDFFFQLYRVKSPVRTGFEFSGVVLEGDGDLQPGTRIFGYTSVIGGPKTHQEIISIPAEYVAVMPDNMSFPEAAALPLGAQTSFVAIRDVAKLKAGQSVLIVGGSGGLGVFSIQFARQMGLKTTGVAGPAGQAIMKRLGADETIDYQEQPLSEMSGPFDAALDWSNTLQLSDVRHLLAPRGIFVPADPFKHLGSFASNSFRRQKAGYLMVDRGDRALLTQFARQVEDGALEVGNFIELPFDDIQNNLELLKKSGRIGRIVLKL